MVVWESNEPAHVLHIVQGTVGVSDVPVTVYTALIGSSVLVCLCDPIAKLGGMAHFLFPDNGADARFGAVAMEVLLEKMRAGGGQVPRLHAKLFGGAKLHEGQRDMGQRNAAFAAQSLADLGVSVVAQDLGADRVRRVRFHPASGDTTVAAQDYGAPHACLAGLTGLG